MKWILIIALIIAVPLMLVVVTGAMLPKNHTVSRTTTLRRPPEVVWKLVSGPPFWRQDLVKYQELPARDGHRMWRETDLRGQTITFEAVESVPPRRLVTRIADPKLPFGGTWTYEITPTAEGCSLTITENGEVYNPVFRFVSRFIVGHAAAINAYLKAVHSQAG
ncbi:MAG: SRPBCC family protein [Acidobacteriia bacterium]|nr:SRPBCC family protein [Terriglobia bacterium]